MGNAIDKTCLPACVPHEGSAAEQCCAPKQRDSRDLRTTTGSLADGITNNPENNPYGVHSSVCGPFRCGAFADPPGSFRIYHSAVEARRDAKRLWKQRRVDAAYDAFNQALGLLEVEVVPAGAGGEEVASNARTKIVNGSSSEQVLRLGEALGSATAGGAMSSSGGLAQFKAELYDEVADFLFENHANPDPATMLYDKACNCEPGNPNRWYKKGVCLQMQGRYSLAMQNFNKALAIDPRHKAARFNLGVVHFNTAEFVTALEIFTQLHDEEETARAEKGRGKGGPAQDSLRSGRSDHSVEEVVNLLTMMADCHERLESPAKAAEFLEKALRVDPYNRTAQKQLEYLEMTKLAPVFGDTRTGGGPGGGGARRGGTPSGGNRVGGSNGSGGDVIQTAAGSSAGDADLPELTHGSAAVLDHMNSRNAPASGKFRRFFSSSGRASGAGHIMVDSETVTVGCY